MFKEDITRKIVGGIYTGEDALLEIIILILVAFVLGWIARWLWDTFFKGESELGFFCIDYKKFILTPKSQKIIPASIEVSSPIASPIKKENLYRDRKVIKNKNDDLRVIEGIGPKIESLLGREGIDSFHKLSQSSEKELKKILKKAGDRYAFHNPATWPEQAMIAREEKWDELEEFQDFLKGGRVI